MDIDFHYHATFAAARFAGFSAADALVIATSAQMIDENGRHVLVKKTGVTSGLMGLRDDFELREEAHGQSLHTFRVQMTFQGLGDIGTSSDDTLSSIWPVFHFLPGNFVPDSVRETTQVTLEDVSRDGPPVVNSPLWFRRELVSGASREVQDKFRWLCRPHSPMAIGLVNNCTDLVHDRTSQVYKQRLTPYMVGVTMHVFIDTWAHQDFVGPASRAINSRHGDPSIGFPSSVAYQNFPSTAKAGVEVRHRLGEQMAKSEWKGTAPGLYTTESANIYVGHGQVGHWPDHSSLIWRYKPGWSATEITRHNPVHYFDAFVHMVFAMLCIRNNRQYTPFEVNERSLTKLYSLSASAAGDTGVALTADRLRAISYLIHKERDPWGMGAEAELPSQISDKWDKGIYVYGREWQRVLTERVFPDSDITTDWVPGASDWVHEALGAFKMNKSMSRTGSTEWLSVGQFQSLPFVKFNLASKFHYRFVKQQLTTFGESLLGSWADGAAYADDLARVENIPDVRALAPWKIKVLDVLGARQRETKQRDIAEGLTILISELEGASNALEAVRILKRALAPETSESGETWTYGMAVDKKGALKHGKTYETISELIKQMEKTSGFAGLPTYLPLPTVSEWERRSSVTFSLRSSDPRLVAIDEALKLTHKALKKEGFSNRDAAWTHAAKVVESCGIWQMYTGREKKRDPAVAWLLRSTIDWIENDKASHPSS